MPRTPRKRHRSSQRGEALVEFALVLPMLLVLTFLVIDFSRAFFVKNMLHQAVREGVRYLAVNSVNEAAIVRARVEQVAGGGGVTVSNIVVSSDPTTRLATVSADASFNWYYLGLLNYLGVRVQNPMTLSASCVMRDE